LSTLVWTSQARTFTSEHPKSYGGIEVGSGAQ